jgi:hypothetical protein
MAQDRHGPGPEGHKCGHVCERPREGTNMTRWGYWTISIPRMRSTPDGHNLGYPDLHEQEFMRAGV